jgi:hypothetical protein
MNPSTVLSGFGKDSAIGAVAFSLLEIAQWLFPGVPSNVQNAILVVLFVGGGAAVRYFVQGRPVTKSGLPVTSTGTIVLLAAVLALAGCASTKSIPTSSESVVTAESVSAKGGAISCESGFTGEMDPTGEWLAKLGCAGKLGWTDPPSPEETTGLGQALGSVMKPFSVLAEALARLIPGAP